jgi:hypothetical protein
MYAIWPWEFATGKLIYPFPAKGVAIASEEKKTVVAKNMKKTKNQR